MVNPVVSIGPVFRAGDSLSLRSHSRQRASVLPNTREWLLPPGGSREATRAVLKLCPTDPAEPFAITFAPPREWLRVKDHVPPETELHREGFKMLSSIQIQQTIYGLDEQPNVLWLAQKCVYASLTCHGFRERA